MTRDDSTSDAEPDDSNGDDGRDLTSGSVMWGLLEMAGPMLVGLVSVMSMSVIDTFFVGQLGTLPLAAMSFSFPVIFFAGGISTGLGEATASVVSRAVGDDDHEAARRLTTHALLMALSLVLALLAVGFPFMEPLFRLLGADAETMPLIVEYMTIWLFGMVFFVVPVVGTSALRARGDARTPMLIMLGATVVNLGLDPLLIFGSGPVPGLGLQGAALATAIARGLSTTATFWILARRDCVRALGLDLADDIGDSWRPLLRIGAPSAGTNVVVPVTTAILTRIVSSYGEAPVAAYGAGSRIESLAILVFFSLRSGLAPIVGQSWGAGLRERVDHALSLSQYTALGWGLATWVLFALAADPIATLFVEGADTAEYLALFLMLVPMGYAAQGIFLVCSGTLNAIDRPLHAASLSLTRTLVLTAPLAWIASYWFGVAGVFGSIAVANVLVGLAAWLVTRRIIRTAPLEPPDHPKGS